MNWISVKDELPDYDVRVLVTQGYDISISYRWEYCEEITIWCDLTYPWEEITHWMHLPSLIPVQMENTK